MKASPLRPEVLTWRAPAKSLVTSVRALWLWTAAFLAAAALAAIMWAPRTPWQDDSRLAIRPSELAGTVRLVWDPEQPPLSDARVATLQVQDGVEVYYFPVDATTLGRGSLDYVRRSDDVLLTLTVFREGQPAVAASVRSIGAVEPPVKTVVAESKVKKSRYRPRPQGRRARRR